MRKLREQTVVECPVEDAEARLRVFWYARRALDGRVRMRLHVLDREVRVEAQEGRDEQQLNDVTHVSWQPEGRTILPHFEGTLVVWGEDDPTRSFIELDGCYHSPLGAAGLVFDEAIGHQIAQATAREFLRDLKTGIEATQGAVR